MDLKQIALIYFEQHLEKILRGIIAISIQKNVRERKKRKTEKCPTDIMSIKVFN